MFSNPPINALHAIFSVAACYAAADSLPCVYRSGRRFMSMLGPVAYGELRACRKEFDNSAHTTRLTLVALSPAAVIEELAAASRS